MSNRHGFNTGWFIDSNEQPVNLADIINATYFDGNHDVLVVMDNETKRTLDGDSYKVSRKITSLTTGTSTYIRINTGSKKVYSTTLIFNPDDGGIDLNLFEGASISGGTSTSLNSYNIDRNSSNVSEVSFTAFNDAATLTGGTNIETLFLSGTGKDAGESFQSSLRFIFKPNTTYVRRITNNSGGDINIGLYAEFYEFD